jgi:hypothetical protein
MPHISTPRRLPKEPDKGTTTGPGSPLNPPSPPEINRLASYLAAEWSCRHEECVPDTHEVTP